VDQTSVATPASVDRGRYATEFRRWCKSPAARAEHALMGVPMVVEPDIEADNGVIHRTDLVHLPPEALRSF
jgi:hypothetical protein